MKTKKKIRMCFSPLLTAFAALHLLLLSPGFSEEKSAKADAPTSATEQNLPAPPQNIQVFPSGNAIVLTWDNSADKTLLGYHVYARRSGTVPWYRLTEEPFQRTLFRHRGLKPDEYWEYYVTAVSKDGAESYHYLDSLQETLDQIAQRAPAHVGIYCYHFGLHEEAGVNHEERFPAMSGIKLAIASYILACDKAQPGLLKKELSLDKKNQVKGSGGLRYHKPGDRFTIQEALKLMLRQSDNTAGNSVIDAMGGVEKINAGIKNLGFPNIMILKKIFIEEEKPRYPELTKKYELSMITPREQGLLFRKAYEGKLIDPQHDELLLKLLTNKKPGSGLKMYLNDRPEVTIINKTGSSDHNRLDSGLFLTPDRGNWVLVVVLRDYPEVSWDLPHPCIEYIADISWEVYRYFGSRHGVWSD